MSCGPGTFSPPPASPPALAPRHRVSAPRAAVVEDWVLWALRSASVWPGCQGPGRQHSAQSPSIEKGKQGLDQGSELSLG